MKNEKKAHSAKAKKIEKLKREINTNTIKRYPKMTKKEIKERKDNQFKGGDWNKAFTDRIRSVLKKDGMTASEIDKSLKKIFPNAENSYMNTEKSFQRINRKMTKVKE